MRILVCIKRVPAPGTRIVIGSDGRTIDTTGLGFTTSPHEESAVEIAVQLTEKHGGTVTVMTLGPSEAEEQLRYANSVGASDAILIPTGDREWDPQATARGLTAAIDEVENEGVFDLILFGNESADSGGYQVGIRVSRNLGRPMVAGITGIKVSNGIAAIRRDADSSVELYELTLPAVIGVKEGIALPRYPTLRGRLSSKKVEIRSFSATEIPGGQSLVRLMKPTEDAKETVFLADAVEAADVMAELGLL